MIALGHGQAISLARDGKVALAAAIDVGPTGTAGSTACYRGVEGVASGVGTVRIEAGQGKSERWYGGAYRVGKAESLLMNGAEGRDEGSLLRTLAHLRLAYNPRSEILIAKLARQQQQCEDTEAEGGP